MSSRGLRIFTSIVLCLFAVQFLAGMILNVFVELPHHHPGTVGESFFSRSWLSLVWSLSGGGGWELVVHAGIAVGLVVGTVALFGCSLTSTSGRVWRVGAGVTALVTIGAFFNGLSFLDFNQAFSSMIMAACWLIAAGTLVLLLVRSRPDFRAAKTR